MNNILHKKYLPILIIGYKRPKLLSKLLKIIGDLKINYRLYVFIDGYKNNKDKKLVLECQKLIKTFKKEDVLTFYSNKNLGCGRGPVKAINWLFKNEPFGVILEDDCMPHDSFFTFCKDLLEKFANNRSIFHISGNQFDVLKNYRYSYVFSRENHSWGWATWSRAWRHYDYYLIPNNERETIWDYQWHKTIIKNRGITILPVVNLVKNIGFGKDAIHTTEIEDCYIRETKEMKFPLKHPKLDLKDLYITKKY